MGIALTIVQLNITNLAVFIVDGQHLGIDKTLIRCQIQLSITLQHFLMQLRIHLHGITLHQLSGCLEITFTLDALNLCQQSGYQFSKLLIIRDFNEGFAIALHQSDHVAVLITPMGNEGPVTHVGFFYLTTWRDADQLRHQSIHHIGIILRLISLTIRRQSQLHQLLISDIIQSEEISPCLLYRIAISLQSVRIHTRQQPSTTMPQTLVEIRMQVITDIPILLYHLERIGINHKLLLESIAMSRLIIGIGNIADGNALTAILSANPVGIRQVDTDGRRRIFIATQHRSTDHAGSNALHHRFLESVIHRRVILKPLGILTDSSRPLGGFFVHIFHQSFPRALQS